MEEIRFPLFLRWQQMGNRRARRQQGSGVAAVLIPCVICKPAEEIEKATGKEEQFRAVKGRVIEKNLPSISPFGFAGFIKGDFLAGGLPTGPAKWKRTVATVFVFDGGGPAVWR